MTTRTGDFRIGLRAGVSEWQRDLPGLARWAVEAGFELLELPARSEGGGSCRPESGQEVRSPGVEDLKAVQAAGMDVICVDVLDWPALVSTDSGRRKAAVDRNAAYFHLMAAHGVRVFLAVATPEDPHHPPRKNFELVVDSYGQLAEVAEKLGAVVVLEGWPGEGPYYANLCCNPEQCRALLKAVPGKGLGLCYDPSHLIRMGIDHARFLEEFATRVGHVHAKDAEVLTDNLYEVGLYQRTLTEPPWAFGELAWRYTIPGHGVARWPYIFRMLQLAGYKGSVSLELEDAEFSGSPALEQTGLLAGMTYLRNA